MTEAARTTSPRAASAAPCGRWTDPASCLLALGLCLGALALLADALRADAFERSPARVRLAAHRIDLASAPAEELALLPEVGARLASRIAADRAVRGPFDSVGDLARVGGFGAAKIEALRDAARAGAR